MPGLERMGVGVVPSSFAGNEISENRNLGVRAINKGKNFVTGTLNVGTKAAAGVTNLVGLALITEGSRQGLTSFVKKNPEDLLSKSLPNFMLKNGKQEGELVSHYSTKALDAAKSVYDAAAKYFSKYSCEVEKQAESTCQAPTYGQNVRELVEHAQGVISKHAETAKEMLSGYAGNIHSFASSKFPSITRFFISDTCPVPAKPTLEEVFEIKAPVMNEEPVCTQYSQYAESFKTLANDVAQGVSKKAYALKDSLVNALSATDVSSEAFMDNAIKLTALGLALVTTVFAVKKFKEASARKAENQELISQNMELAHGVQYLMHHTPKADAGLRFKYEKAKADKQVLKNQVIQLGDIAKKQQCLIAQLSSKARF